MATERTLGIIKPDAVANRLIGEIIRRVEASGLQILGLRFEQLTDRKARGFYFIHKERPFFESLIDFMTSGPVVVFVMEGENAVARWRELMGPTNPKDAPKGSIRGDMAMGIEKNSAHGSDSLENASTEINYFFGGAELQATNPDKVFASGE
jgi:nucleoside-diphosphate kinase